MQLYLIRHAQSENNARAEAERVEDPGITELGREQCVHLARAVAELQPTRLITSPFLRTLQTADAIARLVQLQPEVRSELHEQGGCYMGHIWGRYVGRPGMTRRQIETAFPGYQVSAEIDDEGWWKSRPYETATAAVQRAARLLQQATKDCQAAQDRVVYVMHADIKRLVVEELDVGTLDVPFNASITRLDWRNDGWELQNYSRVDHLPLDVQTS